MPLPAELKQFFEKLVEKSKRSEINWRATDRPDSFQVDFPDMAIRAWQDGEKQVRIELLNDAGSQAASICVDYGDEEWIGAVALINTATRKVSKVDATVRRALEELGKSGVIGENSADS